MNGLFAQPLAHGSCIDRFVHIVPVEFARHKGGAGNADPRIVEQAPQGVNPLRDSLCFYSLTPMEGKVSSEHQRMT